ncbi:transmembrane protein, putative [Medicago truncatula]|uniref:Transmembrane protein, putative n=1 Tax=Medicago truncatula TaxID=3880 RepID=A0A072TJR4_MEDTR|nr:transmembrane protein, putative [Medicago truncatula]
MVLLEAIHEEAKLTLKLAPEIIEPETLRRSTLPGSKPIPLGQPKWYCLAKRHILKRCLLAKVLMHNIIDDVYYVSEFISGKIISGILLLPHAICPRLMVMHFHALGAFLCAYGANFFDFCRF